MNPEETVKKLLNACKKAFNLVDDEDNNKEIVKMSGSFGLHLDLNEAIKAGEKYIELTKRIEELYLDVEEKIKIKLIQLLSNDVLTIGNHCWKEGCTEEIKNHFGFFIVLNNIFSPSSTDVEEVFYNELECLYEEWDKYKNLGKIIWACKKRKEMPIKSVYEEIKLLGIKLDLPSNKFDLCLEINNA